MPSYKELMEKAERRDAAAAHLNEAERVARAEKTERLRRLRLAKEETDRVGLRPGTLGRPA